MCWPSSRPFTAQVPAPELMDLLREAVRRGKGSDGGGGAEGPLRMKKPTSTTERLESVGAQVVYGVVGLKPMPR